MAPLYTPPSQSDQGADHRRLDSLDSGGARSSLWLGNSREASAITTPETLSEELIDHVRSIVGEISPHMRELGIEIVMMAPGRLTLKLPYRPEFVGHPETGVLHGGAVTVLLDSCSGLAVATALRELVPVATLDLRIDYLRPAEPGKAVLAQAHCYKVTRAVAFTRGFAYQQDESDPIAHCAGSFILSSTGEPVATTEKARPA